MVTQPNPMFLMFYYGLKLGRRFTRDLPDFGVIEEALKECGAFHEKDFMIAVDAFVDWYGDGTQERNLKGQQECIYRVLKRLLAP